MTHKKSQQLGMNPSTAQHRLSKDILWSLIQKTEQCSCYRCGKQMTRDNFSIEHKIPWLDSEDPVGLFFDLENIAFSHLKCNVGDARKPWKKFYTDEEKRVSLLKNWAESKRRNYTPEKRRERYLKEGR